VAGLGVVPADPDRGVGRRHLLALLHPRRTADGPPITGRVIEYTVHTSTPGDSADAEESSEVFALVTDLLDSEAYPARDLACAYPMRWGCETVIGHHKTDMGAGMAVLRSKDPEGVAQEMWPSRSWCAACAVGKGLPVVAQSATPRRPPRGLPHAGPGAELHEPGRRLRRGLPPGRRAVGLRLSTG
jgi:hypothetical protein